MTTCVVGLGKIGLPLAVQIASKGENVIGCDINEEVVDLINMGEVPFPGETNLAELLLQVRQEDLLKASIDTTQAVQLADTVVVVVPVIVDETAKPDFSAIDSATRDIAGGLKQNTLICYETTLPIGTTRNRFGPLLQEISGLDYETDFYLAYSPERVFSGRIFADLRTYPKLVGGINDQSTQRAITFYESVLDFDDRPDLDQPNGVWNLGKSEAAEMAKLIETTYRNVNIALANEFAIHAEELSIDIGNVIQASNSQPFSHIHNPGVAVGGHCIPVYPKFYLSTHENASLPQAAISVNESMPIRAVEQLKRSFGNDVAKKRVAILGAAYRGGVKETAFSGVFSLVTQIAHNGWDPLVHDPLYTDTELIELGFQPFTLGESCDAAIIQTDHEAYKRITSKDLPDAQYLYDGRRILSQNQIKPITLLQLGSGQ